MRHLVIRGTAVKVLEGADDVLAEARGEHVLLHAKLVPRLPDDGVDNVQPGHLVFWFALLMRNHRGKRHWHVLQLQCKYKMFDCQYIGNNSSQKSTRIISVCVAGLNTPR